MKTLKLAAFAALLWPLCGAGPVLSELTVKAPAGPGTNYLRLAEQQLADFAGDKLVLEAQRGPWAVEANVLDKAAGRAAVASGKFATIIYRHLTAAEKAAGLGEAVFGYYGAVLVVHPDAPIDGISASKWAAYLTAKKEPADLRWSTLADVPAAKDAPLAWSLPDAANKAYVKPFTFAHAFPERLTDAFPTTPAQDPDAATYAVAKKPHAIAVHGFDFVLDGFDTPFNHMKVLKVGGIAPNARTFADETYPFARPVVFVYGVAQAAERSSATAKFLTWLASGRSKAVAQQRMLVPPVSSSAASH